MAVAVETEPRGADPKGVDPRCVAAADADPRGVAAAGVSRRCDTGVAFTALAFEPGDAAGLTEDALLVELRAVEQVARRVKALQVELMAEVEARRVTRVAYGLRPADWLARCSGCPGGEAHAFTSAAASLASVLPETFAALRAGTISWRKAEFLARQVTGRNRSRIAAIEAELLTGDGPRVTYDAWRTHVTEQVRLIDLAAEARAAEARAAEARAAQARAAEERRCEPEPVVAAPEPPHHRPAPPPDPEPVAQPWPGNLFNTPAPPPDTLEIRHQHDGSVRVLGHFHGASAAIITEQIEAGIERAWHRHRNDNKQLGTDDDGPGRAELAAEAFVDMCTHTSGAYGTPLVTIRMQTDHPELARTATGHTLDPTTLDLLLGADARFRPMIERSTGVPLWFGTEVRFATAHIREAAMVRDGGCVFPGCTAPPRWATMHHTFPHSHGGPTSIEYCASLCPHHHRSVIHRTGWIMWPEFDHHNEPTGRFIIHTPTGHRMYSQQHGRQPNQPPPNNPPPPWVHNITTTTTPPHTTTEPPHPSAPPVIRGPGG